MATYSASVYKQDYTVTFKTNSLVMSNSSLSSAAELPGGNATSKHDQQSFSQRFILMVFNSLLLDYTVTNPYILSSICISSICIINSI